MFTIWSNNSQVKSATNGSSRSQSQACYQSCGATRVLELKLENAGPPIRRTLNGSIIVAVAIRASTAISSIVRAVESTNISSLEQIVKRYRKSRKPPDRGEISKIPITAEVRYAGKPLTTNIFVGSPRGVEIITFPFNGGELNHSEFSLIYATQDVRAEVDAVIVILQPILSSLEKRVCDRVRNSAFPANVARMIEFEAGWSTGEWMARISQPSGGREEFRGLIDESVSIPHDFGLNSTAEDYLQERTTILKKHAVSLDR